MRTGFVRRYATAGLALGLMLGATAEVLPALRGSDRAAALAARRGASQVKSLQLETVEGRLRLNLNLEGQTLPQVVFSQQGDTWVADLANTKLSVGSGDYRQENPAPGIRSLSAKQIERETVRVEIAGDATAPRGFMSRRTTDRLVFDFIGVTASASSEAVSAQAPEDGAPSPSGFSDTTRALVAQSEPNVNLDVPAQSVPAGAAPPAIAEDSLGEAVAQAPIEFEAEETDTESTSESDNFTSTEPTTIPRLRTRAIAPPVGDIAIGTINLTPPAVNLGSNENVTLSLRDAPVSDVLGLLVRRAGLNVILNDVPADEVISLDVQDTPLQEVFNSILRLNQLSSERVGATVFVGRTLPGVQDTFIRTFRLNQASAVDRTFEEGGISPSGSGGGGESGDLGGDIEVKGILPTLESLAAEGGPLVGMKFFPDERTNSITALGTPQQLDIVAAQISQLDVRKRQVLINVKLVDVELANDSSLGIELGSTTGNFAISGVGSGNFGGTPVEQPQGSSIPTVGPSAPSAEGGGSIVFNTANRLKNALALRVDALIESNDAKVLADPKIVVSDGGFSTLSVGQQVIINRQRITDPATLETTERFEFGTAGVTLNLRNVRIDDNGYVSMDISPQVSSPGQNVILDDGTQITLLNQRTVNSQQVRFRDGETLVLSGLIQDIDRVTVSKVPILGDIPLLGSLFRRQNTDNTRNEVVLMVTPNIIRDEEGLAGTDIGRPVSRVPQQ